MYDESLLEARSLLEQPLFQTALTRVVRILGRLGVASQRTLESKISESGRGAKAPPHFVYYALRKLGQDGVVQSTRPQGAPCQLFELVGAPPSTQRLDLVLELEHLWHRQVSSSTKSIGRHAELLVERAFDSPLFYRAPGWGNVTSVNGIPVPGNAGNVGSVDGLVMLSDRPPADGSAVVEIKNTREWVYPRDTLVWDIIRCGFTVNAVPILFARKIYSTTFFYVLSRVGAVGVQMHNQLVPASRAAELAACKHKEGLGFKDILFTDEAPKHVISAISIVAAQIPQAKATMTLVREAVIPYLDDLADPRIPRSRRRQQYSALQTHLDAVAPRMS